GLGYLRSAYQGAIEDKELRARLGKLIKDHGLGPVLDALQKTQREKPVDPFTYIAGILRQQPSTPSGAPPRFESWKDREIREANDVREIVRQRSEERIRERVMGVAK